MLAEEIADIIEFKDRKAQRVEETVPMVITTEYTFERRTRAIKVKTSFNNQALDHRLRVCFESGIQTDVHHVDSIFEVAKRANQVDKAWENPCNAQHQQLFVNLHDEKSGLTIANKGLAEYEILNGETIAVTLHRGVRELGDWGIFMTPEAQCLGEQTVEFAIIVHGSVCEDSYKEAHQYVIPFTTGQLHHSNHTLPAKDAFMSVLAEEGIMWSALKVSPATGDIIGRWYNTSDTTQTFDLEVDATIYKTNLLEEVQLETMNKNITATKGRIVTLGFKK